MSSPILRYFDCTHLPAPLQEVALPIHGIAVALDRLPDGPEKSAGMRKLLEAKDCFVRAAISPYVPSMKSADERPPIERQ